MKCNRVWKTILALLLIASAICCGSCTKKVTSLYLSESEIEIREGDTSTLICTVLPSDASDKSVS